MHHISSLYEGSGRLLTLLRRQDPCKLVVLDRSPQKQPRQVYSVGRLQKHCGIHFSLMPSPLSQKPPGVPAVDPAQELCRNALTYGPLRPKDKFTRQVGAKRSLQRAARLNLPQPFCFMPEAIRLHVHHVRALHAHPCPLSAHRSLQTHGGGTLVLARHNLQALASHNASLVCPENTLQGGGASFLVSLKTQILEIQAY